MTVPPVPPGVNTPDLDAITRSVVGLHKELFGRGPVRARAFLSGDTLVCTLGDGFAPAERRMIEAGLSDEVRRHREVIGRVERRRFASLVGEMTGRRVVTHLRDCDPETGNSVEVFVLDGSR